MRTNLNRDRFEYVMVLAVDELKYTEATVTIKRNLGVPQDLEVEHIAWLIRSEQKCIPFLTTIHCQKLY